MSFFSIYIYVLDKKYNIMPSNDNAFFCQRIKAFFSKFNYIYYAKKKENEKPFKIFRNLKKKKKKLNHHHIHCVTM